MLDEIVTSYQDYLLTLPEYRSRFERRLVDHRSRTFRRSPSLASCGLRRNYASNGSALRRSRPGSLMKEIALSGDESRDGVKTSKSGKV